MDTQGRNERPPQLSAEHLASKDIIKRIRKLRWMGMDEEAKALQGALHAQCDDSVLVVPRDTD